jgi:hypothetical protein
MDLLLVYSKLILIQKKKLTVTKSQTWGKNGEICELVTYPSCDNQAHFQNTNAM